MLFLFYGENNYAMRKKLDEMIARYLEKTGSDLGLERFDGAKIEAETLISAMTSVPFLVTSRLIITSNLSLNKTTAEAVLQSLDRVPDSSVVVFYEPNIDQRTKFFKSLKKIAKVAEFTALPLPKLIAWIRKTTLDLNGEIDSSNSQFLIEYTGNDQWRLWQELNKLVNFQKNITQDSIRALVEPSFSQTIFDLVEAVARGKTKIAITSYQGLRANKAQPLYILSMIGWQLRNLLVVKAAGGRALAKVASEAKISPFVLQKAQTVARSIPLEALQTAYLQVSKTDYQLKTTSIDADVAVEQLLVEITQELVVYNQYH